MENTASIYQSHGLQKGPHLQVMDGTMHIQLNTDAATKGIHFLLQMIRIFRVGSA